MQLNGKTWDKWQARAAASPVLSKLEWWETLTEEEQAFWREMAENFGPLQFMGAMRNEN